VGKEEDPAVPASDKAVAKVRLGSQNGSQHEAVRKDQVPYLVPAIPSHAKFEKTLDF